jgi:hypothetical protein
VSSHQDWQEEVIARHEASRPFAPENGDELKFKVGDRVVYTNDQGASFDLRITGLYRPAPINSLYATGYRYLLDGDAPWMPVKEKSLEVAP